MNPMKPKTTKTKKSRTKLKTVKLAKPASSQPDVAGLHLWSVRCEHHDADDAYLITTKTEKPKQAIDKAMQFGRTEGRPWSELRIKAVKFEGVLDC